MKPTQGQDVTGHPMSTITQEVRPSLWHSIRHHRLAVLESTVQTMERTMRDIRDDIREIRTTFITRSRQ